MKQTKLREPILYTSLWVVSIVLLVLLDCYDKPTSLDKMWYILWYTTIFLFIILWIYALMWWIFSLTKRFDRDETRDMKKYILWMINDIDEEIEELREKKEELLSSLPN